MEFNENSAIYLQIAGIIYEHILSGAWKPSERIPAVREFSATLEVNPNTVMRTYQLLETMNVIYLKRGTGYFLSENAYAIVYEDQMNEFRQNHLPELLKKMELLKITPDELKEMCDVPIKKK